MFHSKRSHEGYLYQADPMSGRVFECATLTCSHCQKVMMVNPLRTRERAYCPKCDHYVCDNCGAIRAANGGECRTFKQIIEETQEAAATGKSPSGIILSSS